MVIAGRPVGVVQRDVDLRRVAGRQEAGQRDLGHHGVTHGERRFGMAGRVMIEGHGHQPQLACEVRQRQRDGGVAVGIQLDRAVEQRHHLCRGDWQALAAQRRTLVAALVQRADIGMAVQQPPIIVAQIQPEPGAAEQRRDRIRAGEMRELEDTLVDRRHGDEGASMRARHMDGDAQGLARPHHLRRVDRDAEGVWRRVGRDPGQPHGAHRIMGAGRRAERPERLGPGYAPRRPSPPTP